MLAIFEPPESVLKPCSKHTLIFPYLEKVGLVVVCSVGSRNALGARFVIHLFPRGPLHGLG